MKRLGLLLGLILIIIPLGFSQKTSSKSKSSSAKSLVSFPSTYKYIRTIRDEANIPEVITYFIFNSPSEVIWCVMSSDSELFAIAYGTYNTANQTLVFNNKRIKSSYSGFYNGKSIIFKLQGKNGQVYISCNDVSGSYFIGDVPGESHALIECVNNIYPSSELVGTAWRATYDDESMDIYFKSASEVILNEEPHTYIMVDNQVGILSGDNPTKEAFVGVLQDGLLYMHRSGFRYNLDYPWITFYRSDL